MHAVVETPAFIAHAKAAGLSDRDRWEIVNAIAANPRCGDAMEGAGGARKCRFAGRGKGRSGGYRVIFYFAGDDIPVFLIALFGKGERSNLTQGERNRLAKTLGSVAAAYREGVSRHVQKR